MIEPLRELEYAWRRLRRAPAFSVTSLVVLTLGLGATTAMFSVVNAVLLRPLPFAEPEQLVNVSHSAVISGVSHLEQSDASFLLYDRHNTVFDRLGASRLSDVSIAPLAGAPGEPERVLGAGVTAGWLPTLGIAPVRGRTITAADDRPGAPGVVIISDAIWHRKFGGDPATVGSHVIVNGTSSEIVGIMPPSFRYPSASVQVWYPLQFDPAHANAGSFNYTAIARLKRGVTRDAAVADLARFLPRLLDEFPNDIPREMFEQVHLRPTILPLRDVIIGDVGRLLWILFGAVGLVLAIACANVANLFLVRAEGRHRELAVRNALGAGRVALTWQYLGEAVLLAGGGGVAGIGVAALAIGALSAVPSGIDIPRLTEVSLDGVVVLFAVAATLASAIVVSVVPLLRTRRIAIAAVLKESGRAATAGADKQRTRGMLVVAQVALALVLVASSGLLARSFARLRDVKPGFDATNVSTLRVSLPASRYKNATAVGGFYSQLVERARNLPGVSGAALTTWLPLTDDRNNSALGVEDRLTPNTVPPVHNISFVSSAYFATMGVPLLSGRTLGAQNDPKRVLFEAVVSKSFADRYWKTESALGKRIRAGITGPWFTIVGVAGDVHLEALDKPADQAVYFPLVQSNADSTVIEPSVALVVSANSDSPALASALRRIVHDLDPALPTYGEQPMRRIVDAATAKARFLVLMLGVASAVALVLGAVGIYGVMAYGVSLRQREIGVRMALGARPSDVSQMVSRQGVTLAGIGVVVGLAGAIGATRFLRGLLYDVSPTDPLTLGATCVVLLAVALIATWLPARRAAGVDPAVVLRSD